MTKLTNRVISVYNRKTSMRLADPEWSAVHNICEREQIKRKKLFEILESNKDPKLGFTCSVRLFTITYFNALMEGYYPKSKTTKGEYKNIFNTIKLMS